MSPELKRYRLRHRTRPIEVWAAGDGPPLALLHGWGLSGRAYARALLALADHGYRAVAPSVAITDNWSVEASAALAAEALAGVDAAPAPVIGHSFGGVIATQMAYDHPELVSALVAIDSPLVSLGSVRLGRIALPGPHYFVAGHAAAAAALVRSAMARGGLASLARSARWFLGNSHDRTLRALAERGMPCAVVWAEADSLLPPLVGERAADVLGCEFFLVRADNGWPGTRPPDHDWPFRQPSHFADTVLGVLGTITGGRER